MRLYVITRQDEVVPVEVNPADKISRLQALVMEHQCLQHNSVVLDQNRTVESYGLQNESTLQLTLRRQDRFTLYIRTYTGLTFTINAARVDTLASIKYQIRTKEPLYQYDQQVLFHNGLLLQGDERTLATFNIIGDALMDLWITPPPLLATTTAATTVAATAPATRPPQPVLTRPQRKPATYTTSAASYTHNNRHSNHKNPINNHSQQPDNYTITHSPQLMTAKNHTVTKKVTGASTSSQKRSYPSSSSTTTTTLSSPLRSSSSSSSSLASASKKSSATMDHPPMKKECTKDTHEPDTLETLYRWKTRNNGIIDLLSSDEEEDDAAQTKQEPQQQEQKRKRWIKVRVQDGTIYTLEMNYSPDSTLLDVIRHYQTMIGQGNKQISQKSIVFAGVALEHEFLLDDLFLEEDSILNLV